MTRIELWNGDICDLEVDAIVSPAATSLWMSSGIAGEIKRAGGDEIEFAALRQAPAALGDAIVTPAGRLAARVVIHAVSLERDRRTSADAIDRATRSAIARVRELGLTSVAFPALGTGLGGFPLADAARIAVAAIRDELEAPSSLEHVIFALRGAAAYQAFADALSAGEPAPSGPQPGTTRWQGVGPGRAPGEPGSSSESVTPASVTPAATGPATVTSAVRTEVPAERAGGPVEDRS
jgi:O-acetyl-ADP-ribose deacetylase (regulator of RNase III)